MSSIKKEYRVVDAFYTHDLEEIVNKLLNKGWTLAGSLTYVEPKFYQTLVKYEDPPTTINFIPDEKMYERR